MSNQPTHKGRVTVPADGVFDATALLAEFRSGAKEFSLGGETFELLPPTAWPDGAFDAAMNDNVVEAGKMILGEGEYARFTAAGGNAVFLQHLVEKLHGASLGESLGSSSS